MHMKSIDQENPYDSSQVCNDNFVIGESEELRKARVAAHNTTALLPFYIFAAFVLNGLLGYFAAPDFVALMAMEFLFLL